MPLLLALIGNKQDLDVREVPLTAQLQAAIWNTFLEQESDFLKGEVVDFDENWMNDALEIARAPVPAGIAVFDQIYRKSDTRIESMDSERLEAIRGLAMKHDGHDTNRILLQSFSPRQLLSKRSVISLLLETQTYTRLTRPGFHLDDKLTCIVESGSILFRSLYKMGRIIDTSEIFGAATEKDVESFARSHSNLFAIDNVDAFVESTNRNARKYIASLSRSQALSTHSAQSLQAAALNTKLSVQVNNGRIVMPSGSREITELLRFLNDGRYVGPVSGQTYISNSRKLAR